MSEHQMSDEIAERKYSVTVTAKMPGAEKASSFKIAVTALSNAQALVKGEESWRQAVEPTDVRVKLDTTP